VSGWTPFECIIIMYSLDIYLSIKHIIHCNRKRLAVYVYTWEYIFRYRSQTQGNWYIDLIYDLPIPASEQHRSCFAVWIKKTSVEFLKTHTRSSLKLCTLVLSCMYLPGLLLNPTHSSWHHFETSHNPLWDWTDCDPTNGWAALPMTSLLRLFPSARGECPPVPPP
jgi:hypothetical protein